MPVRGGEASDEDKRGRCAANEVLWWYIGRIRSRCQARQQLIALGHRLMQFQARAFALPLGRRGVM